MTGFDFRIAGARRTDLLQLDKVRAFAASIAAMIFTIGTGVFVFGVWAVLGERVVLIVATGRY